MEKREPSYTVGGNVNWYSHYRKQCGGSSEIANKATNDPAILLLFIYMKETQTLTQKDIYTSTFIAALFTIAKM